MREEPPQNGDCDAATGWPVAGRALEGQVLDLVSQQRSQGADFVHVGIGHHGDGRLWTLVVGAPR